MTEIFYETDASMEHLLDADVAVVGYGNQGRSWALNLRDSGFEVQVCVRADASREQAAGEQFVTLLGAANRDPRVFPDPDRFDVGRAGQAPMSFGAGIHYCLGAALARAEGAIVFDRLLDRFPLIEPAWGDERPGYRDTIVLHGLEALPVHFA